MTATTAPSSQRMSATEAIAGFRSLNSALDQLRSDIANETANIARDYSSLVAVGGGRDDHADAYLVSLMPHLISLRDFADRCIAQLDEIHADPFAEGGDDR